MSARADVRTACSICGSARLAERVSLRGGTRILSCADCTNGITDPPPSAEYDDHPFFEWVTHDEARWRSYSRQTVDFITRRGPASGRLLDVGCSHGLLLEEARAAGFDATGVEPSASAVAHCRGRGLAVRHGYLHEETFAGEQFDVIVLSHVVEHVPDPAALLRVAAGLLAPDGVICLCQTNYEGTLPRLLGRRWEYWVAHEHYHHFSAHGIAHLLSRAGLRACAVELAPLGYHWDFAVPTPRSAARVVLNTFNCVVTRLRIGLPYRGDQMYVLARRAD